MVDEDMLFAENKTPFVLNVTNNTPSPPKAALPKKFKPSESLSINDEDEMPSLISFRRDSNSVSSFSDDGLVTPTCAPDSASGWPMAPTIVASGDAYTEQGMDVDEFIQKTLADASKGSNMPKKAPGTPVKTRVSYFGHERPWQSAVASRVGFKDEAEFKKVPRKSLPAVFPSTGGATARASQSDWQPTDTEDDEEYSPSTRRDRYPGLGLGQPHATRLPGRPDVSLMWSRWPGIIRRSSSGAFSSGSESASVANTPTRANGLSKATSLDSVVGY
jgi:mitosis inhibitor protein kinase SWE1